MSYVIIFLNLNHFLHNSYIIYILKYFLNIISNFLIFSNLNKLKHNKSVKMHKNTICKEYIITFKFIIIKFLLFRADIFFRLNLSIIHG